VLSFARSTGDVLFDPSLPVSNVTAHFNASVLGYGHVFGLLGHAASAALVVPYVWGDASGNLGNAQQEIRRSGLADWQIRFAVNLIGGPALKPAQFAGRTPETTLGLSFTIQAPVGQYDSTKLVNIGSNRWAFRPQIGVSYPTGPWYLESYLGVWLFADNTEYFGTGRREQDPIGTLQAHISYTIRPRLWLAFDATYYTGGRTAVNEIPNADRQSNSRIGLTLSVPLGQGQSVKFSWSKGLITRIGGNFTTLGLAWQTMWFD
jgi:hypothetical protein